MADETFEAEIDAAAAAHPFPSPMAAQIVEEARAELAHESPAAGNGPAQGQTLPPGFDAAAHAWPPQKTTRGSWKLKRGGSAAAQLPPDPDAPPDPATAAENLSETFFGVAAQLMGPDWEPEEPQRVEVRRCLTRYFAAHGAIDLPPGPALLLAVGMYALPRVLLPETRTRLAHLFALLTGRAQPAAQPAVRVAFDAAQRDAA